MTLLLNKKCKMKAVPACYPYSGEADTKEVRIHGFAEWCDLLVMI